MKRILFVLIAVLFFSCYKDVENITITGSVVDSLTNEPIKYVDVKVICWIYGDSADQSFTDEESVTIKTNEKGEYLVSFEKGAFIVVEVNLKGYVDAIENKYVSNKKNRINIKMKVE